jgi:large subunit ribosomal protein L22
MEVRSIYRYARISPLKVRDVVREIRGLPVSRALDILNFTPKKAAVLVGKTLRAGIANAENNHSLDVEALVVKEAQVGDGPRFRRIKPAARGSAHPIRKRMSHIRLVLTDEIPLPEPKQRSSKSKSGKARTKVKAPKAAVAAPAAAALETTTAEELPAETEVTDFAAAESADAPESAAPAAGESTESQA